VGGKKNTRISHQDGYGLGLFDSEHGTVEDYCEHGNEPSGSVKGGALLDRMCDDQPNGISQSASQPVSQSVISFLDSETLSMLCHPCFTNGHCVIQRLFKIL